MDNFIIIFLVYKIYATSSRKSDNQYNIHMYMLKSFKYVKIYKKNLHNIYKPYFMNRIYIVLWYNFGCTKKAYKVTNIQALFII